MSDFFYYLNLSKKKKIEQLILKTLQFICNYGWNCKINVLFFSYVFHLKIKLSTICKFILRQHLIKYYNTKSFVAVGLVTLQTNWYGKPSSNPEYLWFLMAYKMSLIYI